VKNAYFLIRKSHSSADFNVDLWHFVFSSCLQFKQKRRFVLGLREVLKHAKLKKIKAVIVAPNLERISSEGKQTNIALKRETHLYNLSLNFCGFFNFANRF